MEREADVGKVMDPLWTIPRWELLIAPYLQLGNNDFKCRRTIKWPNDFTVHDTCVPSAPGVRVSLDGLSSLMQKKSLAEPNVPPLLHDLRE